MNAWPVLIKWGDPPLDLQDPLVRFKRSDWNYFLVDQEAGILAGYWLAEQGQEYLGEDEFDEVLHVIEGTLLVRCEGREYTASPGDTVIVRRQRPTQLIVREPMRAFFICYPVSDPEGYAANIRRLMAEKSI